MGINPEDGGFDSFTREEVGLEPDERMLEQLAWSEAPFSDSDPGDGPRLTTGEEFAEFMGKTDDFLDGLQQLQTLLGELIPEVQELQDEAAGDAETYQEEHDAAQNEMQWQEAEDLGTQLLDGSQLRFDELVMQVLALTRKLEDFAPKDNK